VWGALWGHSFLLEVTTIFGDLFSSLDFYGRHPLDFMVWFLGFFPGLLVVYSRRYWILGGKNEEIVNLIGEGLEKEFNYNNLSSVIGRFRGIVFFYTSLCIRLFGLRFIGFMPYRFNSLSHLRTCLRISIPLWISMVISSLRLGGWQFFRKLVTRGRDAAQSGLSSNLELFRRILRPWTLGLRLCLNITAGQLLLGFATDFYYSLIISYEGYVAFLRSLLAFVLMVLEGVVLSYQCLLLLYLSRIYWDDHCLL